MGDVHGAFKAMKQCLLRADFDYDNDHLVFLGDVADGWPEVPECIEEFLRIRNLVALKGNHDIWLEGYLLNKEEPEHWLSQGGLISVRSYRNHPDLFNKHHQFLESMLPYYRDVKGRLFIHAGFNPDRPVEQTDDPQTDYYWSRDVYKRSFVNPVQPELYPEIYIGHTPTRNISDIPVKNFNVWLMDQGAAWEGYLSLMNVDTKTVYSSERVMDLYPGEPGRRGLRNL